MKRTLAGSGAFVQDFTPSLPAGASSSGPTRFKRPKTSQACKSCRKHKTRCEQSTELGDSCHRCNILALTCSFGGSQNHVSSTPTATSFPMSSDPPMINVTRRPDTILLPSRDDTPIKSSSYASRPLPLTVEELVVGPSHHRGEPQEPPGYYAQSPLGSIWNIMRKRPAGPGPAISPQPTNFSTETISVEQTYYLMNLFNKHYLAWLDIPHLRFEPGAAVHTSNFLVLACCAVTCRHLPPPEAELVLSLLQPMVEHAVLLRTFDPEAQASLEGVQGLLVLATWMSAIGSMHSQFNDGGFMAANAARMSLSLKLDTCSERALVLRVSADERGVISDQEKDQYEDLMWKTRLWVSVCNTEWNYVSCTTGTHRKPITVRSPCDYRALDWRKFPANGTAVDHRDFRLSIGGQISETSARGLSGTFNNLHQFFKDIEELIVVFNFARNIVQPLRFAYSMERIQMDHLYFQQYAGRLLVLFHGLAQIRAWMGAHLSHQRPWLRELEQSGFRFVQHWGLQIIHAAQTMLGLFCEMTGRYHHDTPTSDTTLRFTAAPDALFANVLLATSILLVSRYTMFQQLSIKDPIFVYSPAHLLNRLHATLNSLALAPEHAPRRAASVVNQLQSVWYNKVIAPAQGEGGVAGISSLSLSSRGRDNSGHADPNQGVNHSTLYESLETRSRPHNVDGMSETWFPGQGDSTYDNAVPSMSNMFGSGTFHSTFSEQKQMPHPSLNVQQQFQYPKHDTSAGISMGPTFGGQWDDFSQFTNLRGFQPPQDVPNPSSDFFSEMQPSNFLDEGFWDLFGNTVSRDAPLWPGLHDSHPESLFSQQ